MASNQAEVYLFLMSAVVLHAHFDGKRIVLDEQFDLPANVPLMVTVPSSSVAESNSEREWLYAASSNEAFAYLADPAEDIYVAEDGEPFRDAL